MLRRRDLLGLATLGGWLVATDAVALFGATRYLEALVRGVSDVQTQIEATEIGVEAVAAAEIVADDVEHAGVGGIGELLPRHPLARAVETPLTDARAGDKQRPGPATPELKTVWCRPPAESPIALPQESLTTNATAVNGLLSELPIQHDRAVEQPWVIVKRAVFVAATKPVQVDVERADVEERQVEELGQTDVVGPAHLLVHLGGHRRALDLGEAVPTEELGLEGQHEQPLQLEIAGHLDEPLHDGVADAAALDHRIHRDGAHLAQIRPEHVQCAAPDDLAVQFGHPCLLDRLVERDEVFLQQDLAGVGVDEALDRGHVRGPGASYRRLLGTRVHGSTVSVAGAGHRLAYPVPVSGPDIHQPAAPHPPVLNIANLLTGLRMLLVPVFVVALFTGGGHQDVARIVAFAIFAVAVLTDRVDGQLARRRGEVTEFGKLADPIADKALIGAALIGLSALGDLPWWITVVILVRELAVTLMRFAVIRRGVIPASRGGKLKTVVQAFAIGLYILPLAGLWHTAAQATMWLAVLLTVVTGIDYAVSALRRS